MSKQGAKTLAAKSLQLAAEFQSQAPTVSP